MADRRELVAFDAVRGLAALAVCAGHLRAFLLVDFPAIKAPSLADRIFYFATGLGHQAVVVFFVMSGWLVGGSLWRQHCSARFSWGEYAISRFSRLWVVLLPALVWTFAIDSFGIQLSGGLGYDGNQIEQIHSGPSVEKPLNLAASTFVGNVFFLQTILVPVLGTNGPLWSLANEFWYYVIFPCLALAWHRRSSARSIAVGVAGIALLAVLPFGIQWGFAIWLLGWLGFLLLRNLRKAVAWTLTIASLCLLACSLIAARLGWALLGSDLAVGIPVCGLLVGLAALPEVQSPWLRNTAAYFARISYTLYLFHFPLLAFIFFSFHLTQRQPSFLSFCEFAALLASVLLVASGFWYLFERNTDLVRRRIRRAIARSVGGAVA